MRIMLAESAANCTKYVCYWTNEIPVSRQLIFTHTDQSLHSVGQIFCEYLYPTSK